MASIEPSTETGAADATLSCRRDSNASGETTVSSMPWRPITILEDVTRFNVKHPLQYPWALWLKDAHMTSRKLTEEEPPAVAASSSNERKNASNWVTDLQHINVIDTVEDFWALINNVPTPTSLATGSDVFFFKEGIQPAWEDPVNAEGGSISFSIDSKRTSNPFAVNSLWQATLLMQVGCLSTKHDLICGAFLARRGRGDRIQIWLRTHEMESLRIVEEEWKRALESIEAHLSWERGPHQTKSKDRSGGSSGRDRGGSVGGSGSNGVGGERRDASARSGFRGGTRGGAEGRGGSSGRGAAGSHFGGPSSGRGAFASQRGGATGTSGGHDYGNEYVRFT